ncbi:Bax inhibitor-1 family protein [Lactobacillus sp. DCY120]|uniref:Bax inhibitor-1 family protein n=1 Tax=Bombilactobacillus apium TaxID=2675299 RepID=A0A850RBF2_9LACO|nr:Bax inhibitor-1 family protein [Bombilactobacillus apium]NVY96646.1 Bax inhibitor-1 family protein [Bombilactobacillus apium]
MNNTIERTDANGLARFSALVYLYTGLGVAFWTLCAWALAKNQAFSMPLLRAASRHPFLALIVALVIPIILINLCNSLAQRSYFLTFACYLAFLATFSLLGIPLFYMYSTQNIVQALATTSVIFIVMAGYGYLTKSDLMRWSKTLMLGLIAIIAVSILNLFFFKSAVAVLIMNVLSVIIFMGYIAFDSQNLKRIYQNVPATSLGAVALVASINLILDFINILISILSIFGNNNN